MSDPKRNIIFCGPETNMAVEGLQNMMLPRRLVNQCFIIYQVLKEPMVESTQQKRFSNSTSKPFS